MTRPLFSFAVFAASAVVAGCAASAASIQPRLLAAADPAAPEPAYHPPENPLGGARARTLGLEIEDPTHMHHPDKTPTSAPRAPAQSDQPIYTCPMHPEVRESNPGKCPTCGMALEPAKESKPAPDASPKTSPKASPSPAPTPGAHEHHHGATP